MITTEILIRVPHNLRPITGAHREQVRNRNETMLWLIYKYVDLAYALLVLYSFSGNTLQKFGYEEATYIIIYGAQTISAPLST
jgi:hypothetical protein